jgi:hypothetical protein
MTSKKLVVPDFVPIFEEIRNSDKHLTKRRDDGEYMVSDDEIATYAEQLLASEFYTEKWLVGCKPDTVLLPDIISGLTSDDKKQMRFAVNMAYQAEHRIMKTPTMDDFIQWCRDGRDSSRHFNSTSSIRTAADEPKYRKVPTRKSISLTRLTKPTREALLRYCQNTRLTMEMPAELRKKLNEAQHSIDNDQLFEEFGEYILFAIEQWRIARKRRIDTGELIPKVLDQRDTLRDSYPEDVRASNHCAKLANLIQEQDPKSLEKALREGEALIVQLKSE